MILVLLCANIIDIVCQIYFDSKALRNYTKLFDFRRESNIPTFFSSLSLLLSSLLLFYIALARKKLNLSYYYWIGLAVIFLFLCIDETSKIHEQIAAGIKKRHYTTGIFLYAWVLPYGVAVVVFAIAYSRFLFALPRKFMVLFIVSGVVFVTGALVIEMAEGVHSKYYNENDIIVYVYYTFEELLEMVGIALFNYTLLYYITEEIGTVSMILKYDK